MKERGSWTAVVDCGCGTVGRAVASGTRDPQFEEL